MIHVSAPDRVALRRFFLPERPGSQIALHALREGGGPCLVDRWPDPAAVVVISGREMALGGDPGALDGQALGSIGFRGLIEAPSRFRPLLDSAYADLRPWARVVGVIAGAGVARALEGFEVRRLASSDGDRAAALPPTCRWIWAHLAGPAALASSALAWGAFQGERLTSVAAPFTWGDRYEDIGVVTHPELRRRGLGTAVVAGVVADVAARGREASWTTSPDNAASLRIAQKLGYRWVRNDVTYVTGMEIPSP